MSCQSISKTFKHEEIYVKFFDKRIDKRYLEKEVQKFINLNERMFNFLGIEVRYNGVGKDFELSFKTSNFVGAVPIKMPYDGLVHKDFQVVPRFDNNKDVYSELTQLLDRLEYSIQPEYSNNDILCLPMQLKPPTYYEALKYIDLFEDARRYMWVKFSVRNRDHRYPKASTNWSKYIVSSSDSKKSLIFPSRDSILTVNHKEWQELRYVFDIAKAQITDSMVPGSIRFKYQNKIMNIFNNVSGIQPLPTNNMIIRSSDPQCIKQVKIQANILLNSCSNNCAAWRIDMAMLFERYVQHIVEKSMHELSGNILPNNRILGRGNIPAWGLRHLEPDIVVRIGKSLYMADAKYKANFYVNDTGSEVLKETHRFDLHQLLAYCSFEPQNDKVGILFYPSKHSYYKLVDYTDRVGGMCNRVILCGLAFGVLEIDDAVSYIKEIFQKSILMK